MRAVRADTRMGRVNLCACGCGERVTGTWRRGHNARVDRAPLREGIRRRNARYAGALHPRWLGESVNYQQLHKWVNRKRPRTGVCAECGATPEPRADGRAGTDWANISGEYRRDLADFRELCHPCNMAEMRLQPLAG